MSHRDTTILLDRLFKVEETAVEGDPLSPRVSRAQKAEGQDKARKKGAWEGCYTT